MTVAAYVFPTCTRGHRPHPDVPSGVELFVVDAAGPDALGRERFTVFWYEHDREGRLCGHRGQCFHGVVDEHAGRAEARGMSVVVERRAR